jgi:tetratricopeptide (TPR) repeat protein
MNSDAISSPRSLSLEHFSYEALQTAKWEELERFTIEVLHRYYEPFGLSISRTEKRSAGDVGGDGAHDGEGVIIFAGSPEQVPTSSAGGALVRPDLGVLITLWVEVKKRSTSNVDHHDLGGTIFRSCLECVTKLIFVSNRNFTKRFKEDLAKYALRNGMQFSLIDGHSLIAIAEEAARKGPGAQAATPPAAPPRQDQYAVKAQLRFAIDSLFRYADASTADVERGVNEPVFIVADCQVSALTPPHIGLSVELQYKGTPPLIVTPRSGSHQHAVGTGDRFRSVFVTFPDRSSEICLDNVELIIRDDEGKRLDCEVSRGPEVCLVRGTILPDWVPPSRSRAHQELRAAIRAWWQSGKAHAADVLAIAGAGKSHLVREVRSSWLSLGAYEVFLDGGSEQTATTAALAMLGQLFPIPMDEVTSELSNTLAEWLTRSGLPDESARSLAGHVCHPSESDELPFTTAQLGHFLALILVKRSEQHPIFLVFEDLHKCMPSLISMLKALRQSLDRFGRAKIFTLFTTREDSVWDDDAVRRDWRVSMDRMRIGSDVLQLALAGFTREEALELIRAAVPSIEEHYAESVVEQVGTTPFGIREALGLLIERGIVVSAGRNGVWLLVSPDELSRALDSQDLRRATHYRLRGLRERSPDWLADFLDSGACMGKSFSPEVSALNAGAPNRLALESALAECRRLEVLRFAPFSPSQLQFDHDLIRRVLLEDMGPFRQRRLAGGLLEKLADREGPQVLSSLAYQAGSAEQCWSYALKQADAAAGAQRHMEAVQALGLALAVTDRNVVTNIFDVESGRYRPSFDEAIAVAEPCVRPGLTREKRERETAELLIRYAEHLIAVGSGGTPSVDKSLTEGMMLAEKLRDNSLRATLLMFQGRREFNRDRAAESLKYHEAAESMFAAVEQTEEVNRRRAQNLVRLAISQRSNGEREESRRTLLHAMQVRRGVDWSLATNVRANFGATFFQIDWEQTRRHWQRAVRIAKRRGLADRYVHSLVDLAHLDLLEDKTEQAARQLEEALALSRDYGLENTELRCLLNLGCLALMRDEPTQALDLLREADRLGMRHEIGRRLWRVRANMATAYYALQDVERSAAADRITLHAMSYAEADTPPPGGALVVGGTRFMLALANIALRAEQSESHRGLLELMQPSVRQAALEMAAAVTEGTLDALPGLRGRHCKGIGANRFFVITE